MLTENIYLKADDSFGYSSVEKAETKTHFVYFSRNTDWTNTYPVSKILVVLYIVNLSNIFRTTELLIHSKLPYLIR